MDIPSRQPAHIVTVAPAAPVKSADDVFRGPAWLGQADAVRRHGAMARLRAGLHAR